MKDIFKTLEKSEKERLKKKKQPNTITPMLATLTRNYFSKENWIFERKLDGERCLVYKKGNSVTLKSRNQKKLNRQYPEIEDAVKNMDGSFILDGEIVAFDGNVTSFSKLQKRINRKDATLDFAVYYYVFDIIYLNGYELTDLPLRCRKSFLRSAIDFGSDTIRLTPYRNKKGEFYFKKACDKHWEGLIAKDSESTYETGRSKKWLKFKCENRQELVICGFTEPSGERKHFGALLLGFYEQGKLKYAGKAGTGYNDEILERLHEKMRKLKQSKSPLEEGEFKEKDVTWLKPELVGEFRFTEWTKDHKLRHPSFLGLRQDKRAGDVRKEA